MMTLPHIILLLCLFLGSLAPLQAQESRPTTPPVVPEIKVFDHTHAGWTAVLGEHVRAGLFDYAALRKDRKAFDAYINTLAAVDAKQLKSWKRAQRFAFWINAYNAFTVQRVIDHDPVESIKDIGGIKETVWDQEFIPLAKLHPENKDKKLSLNDIEHLILRPRFKDPRVHAAVNCASIGCPPLKSKAFRAGKLEKQLSEQFSDWLADPTRNLFTKASKKAEISMIFKWFEKDFEQDGKTALDWIVIYAPEESAAWLKDKTAVKLRYLDYNWKLNQSPPAKK